MSPSCAFITLPLAYENDSRASIIEGATTCPCLENVWYALKAASVRRVHHDCVPRMTSPRIVVTPGEFKISEGNITDRFCL